MFVKNLLRTDSIYFKLLGYNFKVSLRLHVCNCLLTKKNVLHFNTFVIHVVFQYQMLHALSPKNQQLTTAIKLQAIPPYCELKFR